MLMLLTVSHSLRMHGERILAFPMRQYLKQTLHNITLYVHCLIYTS